MRAFRCFSKNLRIMEVSVFVFEKKIAEKLHKPRRKEMVCEVLRKEVHQLINIKHHKLLHVIHPIEECQDSIAFASEPVFASLANVLGNYERIPQPIPHSLKEFEFVELEIKYGIFQITEALLYLHYAEQLVHRNMCPQSILLTKKGSWKVCGLGFCEKLKNGKDTAICQNWSTKYPKMAQPCLDYIAPEIQLDKLCGTHSDMFMFGMLICAIYNKGRSPLYSDYQTSVYQKCLDRLTETFGEIAHKMPLPLVEPVEKMINRDIRYRPTAQLFSLLKYFHEPVIMCLQHLDNIDQRDRRERAEVYINLTQTIPNIPKKFLYKHVFPILIEECKSSDGTVIALSPLLTIIDFATREEYTNLVLPEFQKILSSTKPVAATIQILERLDVVLAKMPMETIKTEIIPMVLNTVDSPSVPGQEAALNAITIIRDYIDEDIMKKMVLPKAKDLFYKSTNVRLRLNSLYCIDRLLDGLNKMIILDEVLPFLIDLPCQDAEIVMALIAIYKHLLSDKKFGLTHNLIASKVMPTLVPLTVNPGLSLEQFSALMEVLREMLEHIDRQRRNKMHQESITVSLPQRRSIKMQLSMDQAMEERKSGSKQNLNVLESGLSKSQTEYSFVSSYPSGTVSKGTPETSPKKIHSYSPTRNLQSFAQEFRSGPDRPSDLSRRCSLAPPGGGSGPMISITRAETPSPCDFPRRLSNQSNQSIGPFTVPVSLFGGPNKSYLSDRRGSEFQRRLSSSSVGTLPIAAFGDANEKPRRPSTHSLGVFPFECEAEEDSLDTGKYRRRSAHALGAPFFPDCKRRSSHGNILGNFGLGGDSGGSTPQRRPSFQALGESVMQLFSGSK